MSNSFLVNLLCIQIGQSARLVSVNVKLGNYVYEQLFHRIISGLFKIPIKQRTQHQSNKIKIFMIFLSKETFET